MRPLELQGHLPTDRASPVEAPGVLRTLHRERNRAGAHGGPEPVHTRVAGHVWRLAGAVLDGGAQADEGRHDGLVSPLGHEHRDRPGEGRGQGRGGERRVPAGRNGQRGPVGPAPPGHQRALFGDDEMQGDRHQVAGLVAAGDVAGLVFDPDAAVRAEPEGFGEPVRALQWCPMEPDPAHGRNGGVEATDALDPVVGPEAGGGRERVPGKVGAQRHERVGIVDGVERRVRRLDAQEVGRALRGVGAPPGERLGDRYATPAHRAPPGGNDRGRVAGRRRHGRDPPGPDRRTAAASGQA